MLRNTRNHRGYSTSIFSLTLFLVLASILAVNAENITEKNAHRFLSRYGYLDNPGNESPAELQSEDKFVQAVRKFQDFMHINVSGKLCGKTLKMMNSPRCGFPDKKMSSYRLQGSKWKTNNLTYRISKYSYSLSKSKTDHEIQRAFEEWSKVSTLNFRKVTIEKANIDIRFEEGNHDDEDNFDGPGGTIGHATFPEFGGSIHFDDDEPWTVQSRRGINLFQVAVHEIGHALGLEHSYKRSAVMYPMYTEYTPNFELGSDDITAIQDLYGSKNEKPPKTKTTENGTEYDLCKNATIDAIFESADKSIYVFKGPRYWKLKDDGIEEDYPKLISDTWTELPNNIDAAFTTKQGKTYFFKGSKYWKYDDKILEESYPKQISNGFEKIPKSIDAAVWWTPAAKAYFFKGNEYWAYDSNATPFQNSRYPKLISDLKGIPSDLDDVLYTNDQLYFFKKGMYYRYNDEKHEVDVADPPYPRSVATWWFGC